MEDPIEYIKASTDISFLKEMLTKWIPFDYANLKRNYPFECEELVYEGKTPDEILKLKTEGIDKIKEIVENRIKELE